MKTIYFTLIALLVSITVSAQVKVDTFRLDRDLQVLSNSDTDYQYLRYRSERDGKIYVEEYYRNGCLYTTGSYFRSWPKEIPDGHFVVYGENGLKSHEYNYKDSLMEGEELFYDSLGHIEYQLNYKHGRMDGPLKGYYSSGKLRREEVYKDSAFISGHCYDESGAELKYCPRFEQPEFPGGERQMMHFVQEKVVYPDFERENDIQGRVIVKFVIEKDGSLSDIRVAKHVSKGLDTVALNIVKQFPKFKPGKKEGEIVRMTVAFPLKFKLSSE